MTEDHDQQRSGGSRHRIRRWLAVIAAGMVGLIILAAIAVQIVLWTNIPRNLVVSAMQRQLGLRVSAGSLSTGWLGHTTLRDVSLSLPLSDEAFVTAPLLKVSHTSLPALLVGRSVQISSVELDRPQLIVRQDAAGRWNLQQAAEVVAEISRQRSPQPTGSGLVITLPALGINRAQIQIVDRAGRSTTIQPLDVHGQPAGPLVYEYRASVPGHVSASGRLVPGGSWVHELTLSVSHIEPWVAPWVTRWPAPVRLAARWHGQLTGSGLSGQLELDPLNVQQIGLAGALGVTAAGSGAVRVQPRDLVVHGLPIAADQPLRFSAGTIELRAAQVYVEGLRVLAGGGQADVSGQYNPATQAADITASWDRLRIPAGTSHNGALTASLRMPWPDQPRLEMNVRSQGHSSVGDWNVALHLAGSGQSWSAIDWRLALNQLVFDGPQSVALRDVVANLRTRGAVIELDSLSTPGPGSIDGRGAIDLVQTLALNNSAAGGAGLVRQTKLAAATTSRRVPTGGVPESAPVPGAGNGSMQQEVATTTPVAVEVAQQQRQQQQESGQAGPVAWWLWIDASNWVLPEANDAKLRAFVNAWGTPQQVTLEQVYAQLGQSYVYGDGTYVYNVPKPLDVGLHVRREPAAMARRDQRLFHGQFYSDAHLNGTLAPLDVALDGVLHGRQIDYQQRSLGDVDVHLSGRITPQRAQVHSTELSLLGGQWQMYAVYPQSAKTLRVGVEARDVSLKQVADLSGASSLGGRLSGRWYFDMPHLKPTLLESDGQFTASDVTLANLRIDTIQGRSTIDGGKFALSPVILRHGQGRASMELSLALHQPSQVQLAANVVDWPMTSGRGELQIWAQTNVTADLKQLGAVGPLSVTVSASEAGKEMGSLKLDSDLQGRVVAVKQVGGDIFGGQISGQGTVDLDRPLEARGQLQGSAIDTAQVAEVWPRMAPLRGKYSGRIDVAPDHDPRAMAPLRIAGQISTQDGRFNRMAIGDLAFLAFADMDRVVLNYSRLSVANGHVSVWARAGRHAGDEFATHAIVEFDRLDLNQIVSVVRPDARPTPGQISGQATVVGNPVDYRQLYGTADATLADSDLINVPGVSDLYAIMSGHLSGQPRGYGSIHVRLEGQTLTLASGHYFSRGIEAVATGSVLDIFKGWHSPINFIISGSARPLKSLRLPFAADVDKVLSVLQQSLTTIQMDGTLANRRVRQISLQQLGRGLRNVMATLFTSPSD